MNDLLYQSVNRYVKWGDSRFWSLWDKNSFYGKRQKCKIISIMNLSWKTCSHCQLVTEANHCNPKWRHFLSVHLLSTWKKNSIWFDVPLVTITTWVTLSVSISRRYFLLTTFFTKCLTVYTIWKTKNILIGTLGLNFLL